MGKLKIILGVLILSIILAGCGSSEDITPFDSLDLNNFCQIGCVEMGLLVDEQTQWIESFAQAEAVKNQCFKTCEKKVSGLGDVEVVQQ